MNILIVDDQADNLRTMQLIAESCGYAVTCAGTGAQALAAAVRQAFHIAVLDIQLPDTDGIRLMQQLRELPTLERADFIFVTGFGDMNVAIQTFRLGAYDFISKPLEAEEFAAVLRRSAEHQELLRENVAFTSCFSQRLEQATTDLQQRFSHAQESLQRLSGIDGIVAESPRMQEAMQLALRCHDSAEIPVLIEGETGTGKELIARLIHFGLDGSSAPFVDVSCSAIPRELFESEFFGHEEGAFTGSREKGQTGKFETTAGGSILLDDIQDMPLEFQPKLLRVLQERTFYRIGGTKRKTFKGRVITTSNQSLDQMVEAGTFRRDLLHRIRYAVITLPPLRERREDIIPLANRFLKLESQRQKHCFREISPAAQELLLRYPWPGNIRELQGAICRVVLCCAGSAVEREHLSFLTGGPAKPLSVTAEDPIAQLHEQWFQRGQHLTELNRDLVLSALERFDGNQSHAAAYLGISRYKLRRQLQP